MKSRMIAIAVLVVLLGVQGALGSIVANDDIRINLWRVGPDPRSGPFYAVIYDDDPNMYIGSGTFIEAEFLTFCVERRQYFYPGVRYNIDGIADESTAGMQLTGYTSWVYDKFRHDFVLTPSEGGTGYGWNDTRGPETPDPDDPLPDDGDGNVSVSDWGTVINLYQQAIWAGMVQPGGAVGDANSEYEISDWTPYEGIDIGYDDFLASNWAGPGATEAEKLAELIDYQVLNIETGSNTAVQDQMILGGTGQLTVIPEPTSLAIWSLIGLAFAAVWWRRGKSSLSN